jgi:YHS domain-containing protein
MRFLIWLVVLFWTLAMLRRAVSWMLRRWLSSLSSGTHGESAPNRPSNQPPGASSRRLVRDPVCGVHIAEDRSLPLRVGGEVLHFCSAACRDKYAAGEKKYAANG